MRHAGARALKIMVLGAGALGLARPVLAAEWWFVAAVPTAVAFVDLESVQRTGEVVTVTVEHRERQPGDGIEYMRVRIAYDCGKATVALLAEQGFADGAPVTPETPGRETRAVTPGTMGAAIQAFVCGSDDYRLSEGDRLTLSTARAATRFFKLNGAGVTPLTAMILAAYQAVPPRTALEQWIAPELRTAVAAILAEE